jgi:hypothetical protein
MNDASSDCERFKREVEERSKAARELDEECYAMDKFVKTAGVVSLFIAALGAANVLAAQERSARLAVAETQVRHHGLSEQKLNAFAAAYVKVVRVYRDHAAQVEAARTSQQAYQARSLIDSRTAQAIQEEGLSPDEYIAMVRTINENPTLGRKIAQKIRSLQ